MRRFTVLRHEAHGRDELHRAGCSYVKRYKKAGRTEDPRIVGEVTGKHAQEARDTWQETGSAKPGMDVVIDACCY